MLNGIQNICQNQKVQAVYFIENFYYFFITIQIYFKYNYHEYHEKKPKLKKYFRMTIVCIEI